MPNPIVRRVAHTGITVEDLEESVALWRDVLGFEVLGTADVGPPARAGGYLPELVGVPGARLRAAVLVLDGQAIELLQYRSPQDRQHLTPRPCDVGSVHVALEVADVHAVIDACRARGVVPLGAVVTGDGAMAGTLMAYLSTPDGITLELLQPPPTGGGPTAGGTT